MAKVSNTSLPKKFEMLKAQKEPSTLNFEMGKSSRPAESQGFNMLGKKGAGNLTSFLKTKELKTCL